VALHQEDAESRVLEIPQWESGELVRGRETLPSFLYRPPGDEAGELRGEGVGGEWIVGWWAREQTVKTPGRVVHSAKSWLCSHGTDRSASFLPWGSTELSEEQKLSPLRASALLLAYLRGTWEDAWGSDAPFHEQNVTVTVPASFDAAAQKLTLEAARDAGFGDRVQLLEEPQAAFYRWLEAHETRDTLEEQLAGLREQRQHVLIADVGGGTSDFSLFEIRLEKRRRLPEIRRVAVSEHILLGGDNMDLALAHWMEQRLETDSLSANQWSHLVAQCRRVKEEALSERADPLDASGEAGVSATGQEEGGAGRTYRISIPSRGAGLLGGTLTAEMSREELLVFLLDGFYPVCEADAEPERSGAALREWGLPYASDSGITRHLADFLRGLPAVDAVLFNGGSLEPEPVRRRLTDLLERWQGTTGIVILENPETSLAVARGAARYGSLVHRDESRIRAGAAQSLYLESHAGEEGGRKLVCILPQGTPREQEVVVDSLDLKVRVNQPVTFRLYSATKGGRDQVGDVVEFRERLHHPLPGLQTVIRSDAESRKELPVVLSSRLNAIGLLQVECVGAGQHWPLEFQLREGGGGPAGATKAATVVTPGVDGQVLEEAKQRIQALFQAPWNKRDALTPARLVKSLEKILGLPKQDWNAALLRSLWPTLYACFHDRQHSFDHEEAWVSLAGLLLRPGFGVELDEQRMDELWEFHEDGFWYPGKAMQLDADVLWRRVAGGLTSDREAILAQDALQRVRQATKKPPAEAVRLLGALERLGREAKTEIARLLLDRAEARLQEGGYAEPFLAALSRVLNRALFHAGPESVLPPDLVEEAYERFARFDWSGVASGELVTVFLRATRLVNDRTLDLEGPLRKKIVARLRKEGVSPARLQPLEKYVPLQDADRVSLFGESLPAGLVLESS